MSGIGSRYRVVLVEYPEETLPVRYQARRRPFTPKAPSTDPLEVLLEAFWQLSKRGEGSSAWAPVLSDNPLTFLLDSLGDGVVVRTEDGAPMYANPAARRMGFLERAPRATREVLQADEGQYERRCMGFAKGKDKFMLEVLRRLD